MTLGTARSTSAVKFSLKVFHIIRLNGPNGDLWRQVHAQHPAQFQSLLQTRVVGGAGVPGLPQVRGRKLVDEPGLPPFVTMASIMMARSCPASASIRRRPPAQSSRVSMSGRARSEWPSLCAILIPTLSSESTGFPMPIMIVDILYPSRRRDFSVFPSWLLIVTLSGMAPGNAWVAQEKQGSYKRKAISTRLSSPSSTT